MNETLKAIDVIVSKRTAKEFNKIMDDFFRECTNLEPSMDLDQVGKLARLIVIEKKNKGNIEEIFTKENLESLPENLIDSYLLQVIETAKLRSLESLLTELEGVEEIYEEGDD